MATKYTEFDTTRANLLSALRTAVLASSDWSQPDPIGKPDLYKAVATNGAQLVVDFADTAPTTSRLNIAAWRGHDGAAGTDKILRYLNWRYSDAGTTAQAVHGAVSVGKEHIFVTLEGPYAHEAETEHATYGSMKTYFFMSSLLPYYDTSVDPTPAVVMGGNPLTSPGVDSIQSPKCFSSSDFRNQAAWRPGILGSVQFPARNVAPAVALPNKGLDGDFVMFPYVWFDDEDGMRGRLSSFFFVGYNHFQEDSQYIPVPPVGQVVTYNGQQYKIVTPSRGGNTNVFSWGPLGASYTNRWTDAWKSVVVAIPFG